MLRAEHFYQLGEALHRCFDLSRLKEFTIECEVKSVTLEKLKAFQEIGVNRITLTIHVGDVERSEQPHHFLKDLRVGAHFLAQSAVARYLTGYNTTITIASAVATLGTVLYLKAALGLPAATSDQLYGLVGAVLAGGLALTTWLIGLLHDRLPKRRMILGGPALAGVAYLLFLFHPGPGAIFPIFLIVSIGSACSLVPVPGSSSPTLFQSSKEIGKYATILQYNR